jgi:hypothetical protein
MRSFRHHYLHDGALFDEQARQLGSFIGCYAAGDAQNQFFDRHWRIDCLIVHNSAMN